jgi:hypothetical protein
MNDSCSRKTRIVLHVDMDHFMHACTRNRLHRDQRIRLVGVRVSNLKSIAGQRTLA